MARCHQCHPGGEAGLGPALNNTRYPDFVFRWQVRGGYGAMPAYSEEEISEEELDQILTYLKTLRRRG